MYAGACVYVCAYNNISGQDFALYKYFFLFSFVVVVVVVVVVVIIKQS